MKSITNLIAEMVYAIFYKMKIILLALLTVIYNKLIINHHSKILDNL